MSQFLKNTFVKIRVGVFLALRQIARSGKATTALIIAIMALTFLNMVVIGGILVGLIEGSSTAYRSQYSADVLISKRPEKNIIEQTPLITETLSRMPEVKAFSARFYSGGTVEADYKSPRKEGNAGDTASAVIVGIDPIKEQAVTNLSKLIVEGEYLVPSDEGKILVGSDLLSKYSRTPSESLGLGVIENAQVGSKVLVKIGDVSREVEIKGVIKSKIGEVGRRVFFTDRELRAILGRDDLNVGEIAILLDPRVSPESLTNSLKTQGLGRFALIQTWLESQGTFFEDIKNTFSLLGNLIGSIGIVIASITIFIVVFINAVTRRRFIGVFKGLGVEPGAIQLAYMLQAMFYSVIGIGVGWLITFLVLKPFILANPINFPFSDGILVAEPMSTFIKALVLLLVTALAGYIPARIIVKQKTLDAILGR